MFLIEFSAVFVSRRRGVGPALGHELLKKKTIETYPCPECVANRQKQQESKDRTGHRLRQRCTSTEQHSAARPDEDLRLQGGFPQAYHQCKTHRFFIVKMLPKPLVDFVAYIPSCCWPKPHEQSFSSMATAAWASVLETNKQLQERNQEMAVVVVVVCRLSFVVCRLSFVVCRLPFAVCRLPFAVCRLPFAVSRLPFAVRRLSFVVCRLSFVVCRLSFVVCRLSFVVVVVVAVVC